MECQGGEEAQGSLTEKITKNNVPNDHKIIANMPNWL
jgi:hypothetical protein